MWASRDGARAAVGPGLGWQLLWAGEETEAEELTGRQASHFYNHEPADWGGAQPHLGVLTVFVE